MATEAGRRTSGRPARSRVGAEPVGWTGVMATGASYVAISVLLLYALWQFWPLTNASDPSCNKCNFFGVDFTLSRERNFLLIVALAGALGATVHGLRSFARYVGERILYRSWLLLYGFLPLVGATLGTVVYLVLRAGLISGGGVAQADPFGFAAISALVGLFSAQAAQKLKEVFETLFTKPPSGGESVEDLTLPEVTKVEPASGTAGDTIVITGSNFDPASTTVFFGDTEAASVTTESETRIQVVVPDGLEEGEVFITVTTPQGSVTTTEPFEVQA